MCKWSIASGLMFLLVGGMLYVLYRPQTLLLFRVSDALGLSSVIGEWRQFASVSYRPADFVVYSLPAGLWAASYVLITAPLTSLLRKRSSGVESGSSDAASHNVRRCYPLYVAVAFIPLLGAASELMQALHLLPGTYDPADLVLYLLPLAAYAIYETINNKQ